MLKHSETLTRKLTKALRERGETWQPRTRYLDGDKKPVYINRLICEDSPYLLQHAHNPVDWYPWGEEAFAAARQENKPVFLSIGYSTCHWCHVMEEESFDNEEVARYMNKYFICIKVDRELFADVDAFYMTAVMIMQNHGGWPMSSFLTPEGKPFFGGTYYQPAQFIELMLRVNAVWSKQNRDVLQQAQAINERVVAMMTTGQSSRKVSMDVIDPAVQAIMSQYDPGHGGFGSAPKFPNEPYLYFLLEYAVHSGKKEILNAVVNTLQHLACGGIYDHIGGGFHRYATDPAWLTPHFEKMLYNQANLSYLFTRAYCLTGMDDFRRVVCETLDYVMQTMRHAEGGFYSATDADSEGREGLFFIWDKREIETLLNETAAGEFIALYQITEQGNFEGRNIPHLKQTLSVYARQNGLDYGDLVERLARSKKTLREYREKRVPPLRDDKIITAWNGMMIKAFAFAGGHLDRPDYIECAARAARYILEHNRLEDTGLSRASLNGNAVPVMALQEDYACLAEALLQLYDATLNAEWLNQSMQLTDKMIDLFQDKNRGGFFMSDQSRTGLLPASPKEISDNATASGNSVALRTLVRLAKRSGRRHYTQCAQQLIHAHSDDISRRPWASAYLMCGLLEMHTGEQDHRQWCADGHIHIDADVRTEGNCYRITLTCRIDEGWHLKRMSPETPPLALEVVGDWLLRPVFCPEPVSLSTGFQDGSVDVWQGVIKIDVDIARETESDLSFPDNLVRLNAGLQACDDQKCLAPETVGLLVTL